MARSWRRRWFRGPGLLTAAIRMVIFLCSLVFATTVFFAWQFGHSGCFFTDEVDLFGFGSVVPWWVSLVVAFFLLAWVSMVTLPVYSMVLNAAPEDSLLGAELPFLKVCEGLWLGGSGEGPSISVLEEVSADKWGCRPVQASVLGHPSPLHHTS